MCRYFTLGILCFFSLFITSVHTQSLKEKKIQEESSTLSLPPLPEEDKMSLGKQENSVPPALNIDSTEVIAPERVTPNEGSPYFTLSGGLAPYQVSLGILKYFIPEWWGQLDINVTFLPSIPVENYYTATKFFKPYVAFRVVTGYAFYSYRFFEISIIAQIQFAFISSDDVPFLPSLGMRFIIDFFYIDIGVSYAVTIGSPEEPIFEGWYPALTLGFRF